MVESIQSYLLEHFLSGNEFVVMFFQGTFQISDLFSLSFNLVSEYTHLKPTDSRQRSLRLTLKPGQSFPLSPTNRYCMLMTIATHSELQSLNSRGM